MLPDISSSRSLQFASLNRTILRCLDPVSHVLYLYIYSLTALSLGCSTLAIVLNVTGPLVQHFPSLLARSFPTTVDGFGFTPLGQFLSLSIFLGWVDSYIFKQTKKTYREFYIWLVAEYRSISQDKELRFMLSSHVSPHPLTGAMSMRGSILPGEIAEVEVRLSLQTCGRTSCDLPTFPPKDGGPNMTRFVRPTTIQHLMACRCHLLPPSLTSAFGKGETLPQIATCSSVMPTSHTLSVSSPPSLADPLVNRGQKLHAAISSATWPQDSEKIPLEDKQSVIVESHPTNHLTSTPESVPAPFHDGENTLVEHVFPEATSLTRSPGIYVSALNFGQIHIIGPTGKEKVIEMQHRALFPLWLYLVTQTHNGKWARVADIHHDIYGYDEHNDSEKKHISNRLRDHCRRLQDLIEKALIDVEWGTLNERLLLCKQQGQTTVRRICDLFTITDLPVFDQCQTLLGSQEETHADEQTSCLPVKQACEQVDATMNKVQDTLLDYPEQLTSCFQPFLNQIVKTAIAAREHLAKEYSATAQHTPDPLMKRRWLRKSIYAWSRSALTCASFAAVLPDPEETFLHKGERALRNGLKGYRILGEINAGRTLYQKYRHVRERDGDPWEPEKRTLTIWKQLLTTQAENTAEEQPILSAASA
jgi:hypothetical protein